MSFGSAGVPPASRAAIAAAQTLAWALAAKADFGIAPAIAASPMTWMLGCSFDSKRHRIDRAPAGAVGDAGRLGDAPGALRRDDVGDRRLVAAEIGDEASWSPGRPP